MEIDCPYCNNEPSDSRDHIFPSFLGGSQTAQIGKKCNNKFGHFFEAKVFLNFIPFMIFLRIHRVPAPKYVIWKDAIIHDGKSYNIDSNLVATPYKPEVTKDFKGRIINTFGSRSFQKGIINFFKKNNVKYDVVDKSILNFKIPEFKFTFQLDRNIRMLCVKMCVGLLRYLAPDKELFSYKKIDDYEVLYDFRYHNEVEELKVPLSHLIVVESNKKKKSCYGIVQFYGILQFYIDLSDRYFGDDFCFIGSLDPLTLTEDFKNSENRFHISPANRIVHAPNHESFEHLLSQRMNIETKNRFGEDLIKSIELGFSDKV